MTLTKKAISVIYKHLKKDEGKAYGSMIIEKLKGNITYKVYFEMIGDNKYSKEPAYIKLIFPSKEEIVMSPLTEMEEALKKSNKVGMVRYEFEKKSKDRPLYMYVFMIGNKFFDLPEDMAKNLSKKLDIKIQKN